MPRRYRPIPHGTRFGRLVISGEPQKLGKGNHYFYLCQCDCGGQKYICGNHLIAGTTQSCGCIKAEKIGAVNRKHGESKSATYLSWLGMIVRCEDPDNVNYENYGGRGIAVCDEWRTSYEAFVRDMGHRPDGATIDRVDNDLGYHVENCRWATPKVQANNRRSNRLIEAFGTVQTLAQWADEFDMRFGTLWMRLKRGWPIEKALTEPLGSRR